jgi:hypothetical protein
MSSVGRECLQLATAARKGRVDEVAELMSQGADKEHKDQVRYVCPSFACV